MYIINLELPFKNVFKILFSLVRVSEKGSQYEDLNPGYNLNFF